MMVRNFEPPLSFSLISFLGIQPPEASTHRKSKGHTQGFDALQHFGKIFRRAARRQRRSTKKQVFMKKNYQNINLFTQDPWFIERLHILAFIGYHYGVAFLKVRLTHENICCITIRKILVNTY
jgi:hypothetical protein